MSKLHVLPCLDSAEMAASRRRELNIPRDIAAALGRSAVEAASEGFYTTKGGHRVIWPDIVQAARAAKVSIQTDDKLIGARAQEEVLCRSSLLYATLEGDRMYEEHRKRPLPDSTAWAIYSPDVPVFRGDDGTELDRPWLLSFITCAAPYAPSIGQPQAGDLLKNRIHRVLAIARSYGYSELVLGAWGCGAFANDPHRTASDFRQALEKEYGGAFSDVVFAITDRSPERRFLGPFRDVFAARISE
jgi:hypothetical protein